MKANQNSNVREIFVWKQAAATIAKTAAKTVAAPSYPNPESSAKKSPRAVPSVFEKRIVALGMGSHG